jgi:hypothetical protein
MTRLKRIPMRHLGTSVALTAVFLLAACGSNAPTPSTNPGTQGAPPSTTTADADPLDGTTWRNSYTCDDVSKALERAGLQRYEKHVLRPDNLGHCDETMHTTLAFAHGRLTGNGETGDLVQPYELVNDHTYINGFQRVTFRIRGNRMILHMHIIQSLYPYSPKELAPEHAFDVGAFMARPFVRVN